MAKKKNGGAAVPAPAAPADPAPPAVEQAVSEAPPASAEKAPANGGHNGNNGGGRKPPVFECRIGRIRGIIWSNQNPTEGTWYSVNITRSYRDNSNPPQWKQSNSYGRDDLLVVAEVCRICFLEIARLSGSTPYGMTPEAKDDCPV